MTEQEYMKGVWQRELSLFTHYSTVRMTVLAFLIPLGGLMIIQERIFVGLWVVFVAYCVNWLFGVNMALRRWLVHRNIDLWMKWGHEYEYKNVQQAFPGIQWVITGKLPQAYIFKDLEFKQDENVTVQWKTIWKDALNKARKTESFLQLCVFVGISVFLLLIFTS